MRTDVHTISVYIVERSTIGTAPTHLWVVGSRRTSLWRISLSALCQRDAWASRRAHPTAHPQFSGEIPGVWKSAAFSARADHFKKPPNCPTCRHCHRPTKMQPDARETHLGPHSPRGSAHGSAHSATHRDSHHTSPPPAPALLPTPRSACGRPPTAYFLLATPRLPPS